MAERKDEEGMSDCQGLGLTYKGHRGILERGGTVLNLDGGGSDTTVSVCQNG